VARGRHITHGLAFPVVNEDTLGGGVPGDMHVARPIQGARARERRPRVVVARRVYHGDTMLLQASHLLQEKTLGLKGEPIAVEEVASDQERVGVLSYREVSGAAEGLP